MRRCISLVVALVAVSAFAQVRVEKADGTEELIPAVAPVTDDVIIEFRDAPLTVATARAGKTALADYRATFARFRGDLASIVSPARAGKSALAAEVRWEYYRVFNGVSARVPRTAIAAIERLPYVKKVHPDREVQAMAGAASGQIGADKVWTQLGSFGKGVVVAVIDTGIDYTHEALGRGIGPGFKVIGGYDFVNKDDDPFDDAGHGTHVAGIIAGGSATISGVAPQASLMAYKVLNASGSGSQSNVIAAIERSVDPNGDGDLSDHVDVANLSLGGSGGPDDPGSRAINNATLAGVVFCIAAGNSGKYHNISSPGTANSAITVGAVDSLDNVASFSSRGPTPKDLTMKPEIAAPGVSILSSLPGDKYGTLSGTSMATPHVAGACALLKALHRDWTPAQIKMAIMTNAFFSDQELMANGSGRLDVLHAATGPLVIDPPAVNFGLDPIGQARWNQSRTVHVTNTSAQSVTYSVRTTFSAPGINVSVSPASITIAPGATADVTLSLDIDNAVATGSPTSFSAGGTIAMSSSAASVHVPWTFVKAVRAIATWDREFASFLWLDGARTTVLDAVAIDSNASEVLLKSPGSYDVAVNGYSIGAQSVLTRASFIYLPAQTLDGDVTIAAKEADASHRIRATTTTVAGAPFQVGTDQTYALGIRLVWPDGASTLRSFAAPLVPLHEIYVNDVSADNKIIVSEIYADFRSNSLYALQHQPMQGISSDRTLAVSNLRSASVRLLIPPNRDEKVVAQLFMGAPAGATVPNVSGTRSIAESFWYGRVYLAADTDPTYRSGIAFLVSTGGVTEYQTPQLRVDFGAVTTNGAPVPWLYSGDQFIFGSGPRMAVSSFSNVTSALRPTLSLDFLGPLGETRGNERINTTVAVFAADGRQLTRVTRNPIALDLTTRGHFTIEATNDAVQYPDLPLETKVTMSIDSSRPDYVPPTLTTLFIVDGTGRVSRDIDPHGTASLFFSAADYAYPNATTRVYQPVRGDATTVSYRYEGGSSWTALPLTQMSEDPGSDNRVSAGILYRADLSSVANVNWGRFDLRIDLADDAGNTTSVIMQPAFSVGGEYPARRRASR